MSAVIMCVMAPTGILGKGDVSIMGTPMKKIVLLFVSVLLTAVTVKAESLGPVFGTLKESASIGQIDSNLCYLSTRAATLSKLDTVLVIGVETCKSPYSADKKFYKIAFRGKLASIDAVDVEVDELEVNRLTELSQEDVDTYQSSALKYTKSIWLKTVGEVFAQLDKIKKQGIVVTITRIYDISEFTEGTGFEIEYYNPIQKTIKYITANVIGYNAVGDPVKSVRAGKVLTQIPSKGVGPIAPGTSAKFTFDYTWFSDLVETYKISKISIQYMDGSTLIINDPKKVQLSRLSNSVIEEYSSESPVTKEEGEE